MASTRWTARMEQLWCDINYRLHGLELNSNAFERNIVFHSWDKIGDEETYPAGTLKDGAVSRIRQSLLEIDPYLKKQLNLRSYGYIES